MSMKGFSFIVPGNQTGRTRLKGFSFIPSNSPNRIRLVRACGVLNDQVDVNVKIMDLAESVIVQGSTSTGYFYFPFDEITGDYKIQVGNSQTIKTFSYVNGTPINEDYDYLGRIYKVRAISPTLLASVFSNEVEI